mgnify:CR=1 FL=1
MQMTSKAAACHLFWMSGLILGIGAAKEVTLLMVTGGFLTLASLYYFKSFVEKKDET